MSKYIVSMAHIESEEVEAVGFATKDEIVAFFDENNNQVFAVRRDIFKTAKRID